MLGLKKFKLGWVGIGQEKKLGQVRKKIQVGLGLGKKNRLGQVRFEKKVKLGWVGIEKKVMLG